MASVNDDFDKAMRKFTNRLTQKELVNFQFTTLADVEAMIGKIQREQRTEKRMMNLNRIKRFLEGMNELGKVMDTFANSTKPLALVWGPVKFLLQVASTYTEAFDTLLDAYEEIGQHIPLLQQSAHLFHDNVDMQRVLAFMYEDILEFHQHAVRFFSDSTWKKLLKSTWKHFDANFRQILNSLSRHQRLIENQGQLLHFAQYQADRLRAIREFERSEQDDKRSMVQATLQWLCSTHNTLEFDKAVEARQESPADGSWILQNQKVGNWMMDELPKSSILWMHGIPGAGKSVLASVVIQECQRQHGFKTTYFYCVKDDPLRNTSVSILRGLLSQLLSQSPSLLPYIYDKMNGSGEATLSSIDLAKRLFETFCEHCSKMYIIIDGLDECNQEEIRGLLTYLKKIVDGIDEKDPGKLRMLVVSQHLTDIQKRLHNAEILALESFHNKGDIRRFVEHNVTDLQGQYDLNDEEASKVTDLTCHRASGMFLYAKLVMSNLKKSPDKTELRNELNAFPIDLHEAYERIVDRIRSSTKGNLKLWQKVKELLGWMSCARRPLRWYEIQAAVSINTEAQELQFDAKKLRFHIKDTCGALIQLLPGDQLALVHTTAKYHIIRTEFVRVADVECNLTTLCLQYLTFPCFEPDSEPGEVQRLILRGDMVFQDYAAANWFFHLRAIVENADREHSSVEESMRALEGTEEVSEAFDEFMECYSEYIDTETILDTARKSCMPFQTSHLHEIYLRLYNHSERHLQKDLDGRNEISLSHLGESVQRNRAELEELIKDKNAATCAKLTELYGKKHFKCPKATCFWFHEGFRDARTRDDHILAHDRPYRCQEPNCSYADMGFKTSKSLEKHVKDVHPSREDVAMTFTSTRPPPAKTPYACTQCPRRFTRSFHLRSHLRAHEGEKPFACTECGRPFTRANDCRRHQNTVHARKKR